MTGFSLLPLIVFWIGYTMLVGFVAINLEVLSVLVVCVGWAMTIVLTALLWLDVV